MKPNEAESAARTYAWRQLLLPFEEEIERRMRVALPVETQPERTCLTRAVRAMCTYLGYNARVTLAVQEARGPCLLDEARLEAQLAGFDPLLFEYSRLFDVGPGPITTLKAVARRAQGLPVLETRIVAPLPVRKQGEPNVPKHEVKVLWLEAEKLEEEANKLGANGWELFRSNYVFKEDANGVGMPCCFCIFKRVKPS